MPKHLCCDGLWAPSQYPKRRLSVRSRKVSKPRDLYLELSDRSEILPALRQQCCRCACQISKRYDNLKYQSRGFETTRSYEKTSFRILRRGPGVSDRYYVRTGSEYLISVTQIPIRHNRVIIHSFLVWKYTNWVGEAFIISSNIVWIIFIRLGKYYQRNIWCARNCIRHCISEIGVIMLMVYFT